MPTFDELMEQFRTPPETGLPDNFADELVSAYREDISIREAAVTEKETLLAERQKEIDAARAETIRLKAVNYDLIKAAPKPAGNPAEKTMPDDDAAQGVDSLFE
jgi:hypothetical protein